MASDATLQQAVNAIQDPALQQAILDDDRKFRDLIDVILNVLGYEYTPRLVQSLQLPVIALVGVPLTPSFLDISNKSITLAAGVDTVQATAEKAATVKATIDTFNRLVQLDIQNAGGLSAIIATDRGDGNVPPRFKTPDEIAALMPLTTAFRDGLRKAMQTQTRKPRAIRADQDNAVGVAVNQYLLTRLVNGYLPYNNANRDDDTIVPLVLKGFIEYWMRVGYAMITISGTTLDGTVPVDLGGGIGASVWDLAKCPPDWKDIGEVSASFVGNPHMHLSLSDTTQPGISFQANLDLDNCNVDVSGLGWPFDQIVGHFLTWLIHCITDVLDFVASFITFQIMPPSINLDSMYVSISFSDVGFLPLVRSSAPGGPQLPADRATFIAAEAGITISKTSSRDAHLRAAIVHRDTAPRLSRRRSRQKP